MLCEQLVAEKMFVFSLSLYFFFFFSFADAIPPPLRTPVLIFHRNIFLFFQHIFPLLFALSLHRLLCLVVLGQFGSESVRDTLHMVDMVRKKCSRHAQMGPSQERLYRTDTNGRI